MVNSPLIRPYLWGRWHWGGPLTFLCYVSFQQGVEFLLWRHAAMTCHVSMCHLHVHCCCRSKGMCHEKTWAPFAVGQTPKKTGAPCTKLISHNDITPASQNKKHILPVNVCVNWLAKKKHGKSLWFMERAF